MANVIETVNKYLPILDQQYRVESKSSLLDTPAEFVQQTKEAKKVKIAKIRVDGLADYSRQSGFTAGSMDLTWEEHEFRQDRGRALQVDAMDNLETFGLAWGRLAGTFQRDKVIPELDAYRFAEYYQNAATVKSVAMTTKNALWLIDSATAEMDDHEVPDNDRIIFCNPTVYKVVTNDETILRQLTVDDAASKALNKKIYAYNGMPIIKVPSNRFYSKITLYTGAVGQEVGGYVPHASGVVIGLMIVSKSAIVQISKRNVSRYWAPNRAEMEASKADGVNPNADAWKFDFRTYHDAWVLDEKLHGISVLVIDTTIGITSVDIDTDDEAITITGSAGARAATISLADADTFLAKSVIVAVGGASEAVTWKSSIAAKATVDAAGNITLLAATAAATPVVITATSIYNPTKTATLTITITA